MIPNTSAKMPKIHTSATRTPLGHTASNTPKITEPMPPNLGSTSRRECLGGACTMKWVLTLIAHSTCHRSSGALQKRCVGDHSCAFGRLGLAPSIIAPGVKQLPARCPP